MEAVLENLLDVKILFSFLFFPFFYEKSNDIISISNYFICAKKKIMHIIKRSDLRRKCEKSIYRSCL